MPETKVCPECGKTFARPRHDSPKQWAARITCGRSCAGKRARRARPRRTAPPPRITDEAIRRLVASKTPVEGIAALYKVSKRTVYRAMEHANVPPTVRRVPFTDAELDRAWVLLEEGMPLTWIAEDLHRGEQHLRERLSSDVGHKLKTGEGWSQVWSGIRNDPALLALHREFAPKRARDMAA